MAEEIATAKTPADHEALALHFEQEANALDVKAEQHLAMAERYEHLPSIGKPLSPGRGLAYHCQQLADNYRSSAEHNRALAKLHRDLAKRARP